MNKKLRSHILSMVLIIVAMGILLYDSDNTLFRYLSAGIILVALLVIYLSIKKKRPL